MARYEKPYLNASAIVEFEYLKIHFENTIKNQSLLGVPQIYYIQFRLPHVEVTIGIFKAKIQQSIALLGYLKFLPLSVLL